MTFTCLHVELRNISSSVQQNFVMGYLQTHIRAKIISYGIRKQPNYKVYRQSKGGRNLFHHIKTIVKHRAIAIKSLTPRHSNLIHVSKDPIPLSRMVHLAHINVRSVCNKYLEMQEYIVNNGMDLCAVMGRHGLNQMILWHQEKLLLLATMFWVHRGQVTGWVVA